MSKSHSFYPVLLCACLGTFPAFSREVPVVGVPEPLVLDTFACEETSRSSLIREMCHRADIKFMVIRMRDESWYPYCDVGPDVFQELRLAPTIGDYFMKHVRGPRYSCREHGLPSPG
jgi:hypothetical protein